MIKSDLSNQKSVRTGNSKSGKPSDKWVENDQIPITKPERPPAYYDVGRTNYWIQNAREEWIPVSETSLGRHLQAKGYSRKRAEGERLSLLDECLNDIQLNADVAYAGPLAGHSRGLLEVGGQRVLVTSSVKLMEAQQGAYPVLGKLLGNMFGEKQLPYVKGWLKVGYESLKQGSKRPGQVLVLAGPRDSYKSVLQNLITEILGGRSAKPYRYMSGATEFNSDLFWAEHLMIEDEIASSDIRARRNFGTRIKELTVNETQSCHAKNRQALSLRPFWRVTVSVNDEPENLMILPPFEDSLFDKIILAKIFKQPPLMPTNTSEERKHFWQTLLSELPAFIWDLEHWEIPPEMQSGRFGVAHHHDPDLLQALDDSAPETKLLALIDVGFESNFDATGLSRETGFLGTAEQLETRLSTYYSAETRRLFTWSNACGSYLARLADKHPDRVKRQRTSTERLWKIEPPKVQKNGSRTGMEVATQANESGTITAGSNTNRFSETFAVPGGGLPVTCDSQPVAAHPSLRVEQTKTVNSRPVALCVEQAASDPQPKANDERGAS